MLQRRLILADSLLGAGNDERTLRRFIANSERVLQDRLEAELNQREFQTAREMVVVPRDRVDVAVYPNSSLQVLTLIEVKTADPIRGVGQILSYQDGVGEPTHRVLVIDDDVFSSQVVRACAVGEIELWIARRGEFRYITGPPTLWNASRSPGEPMREYTPWEPVPVETCPCCKGVGKASDKVLEAEIGVIGLFEDDRRRA
jgi:hypothetical protein